jgi:hypothetical protein
VKLAVALALQEALFSADQAQARLRKIAKVEKPAKPRLVIRPRRVA